MKLSHLCAAAGIFCPPRLRDVEISSVTSRTEDIKKGSLFVCLVGTKDDGNNYIERACGKGAVAVLSDTRPDAELFVPDAHLALARLCRAMCREDIEKLKLVGVTGTNGKTTVTSMLRSIFSSAGYDTASIGTLGCFLPSGELVADKMTTPDPEELYPILEKMGKSGAEYVFCELSSHALAKKKADALRLSAGIFTNLTRDHLDFHGSEENYFNAKKRIFDLSDIGIVNADDERLATLSGVLRCSARKKADFCAKDIKYYGADGCGYIFCSERYRFPVVSRLPGRFTVMNTLMAAATAVSLGIDPDAIREGLYSLSRVDGRMQRVDLDGADFSVYIDYAHTPDALENLLLTARGIGQRIILLFGCGGDRDRGKRAQMGRIASRLADRVIITSDNRRSEAQSQIFDDILKGISADTDYSLIDDRRAAIKLAIFEARAGDVVLLAGKGHEKYETDECGRHPFDEEKTVKEAYKLR